MKIKSNNNNFFLKLKINPFFKDLKDWFLTDLKVKIFGLLLSIIIWLYIVLGNVYIHSLDVPLEIINIEAGKTLKEEIPKKVIAEFSGKGSNFIYLFLSSKSSFKFILDLQNIHWFYNFSLRQYFLNNPEKIILPRSSGLKFNKIVWPDSLLIELDKFESIKIPVRTKSNIETASGYVKTSPLIITPDSVVISGASTYVNQYKEIFIENFRSENTNTSVELIARLDLPEHSSLNVNYKKVKVFQRIEEISEKVISDIPVKIINGDKISEIELSPSKISLKVSAGIGVLQQLKPTDFEIFFDYQKSWDPSKTFYEPEIKTPDGVLDVLNVIPTRVNVRVFRERTH